MNDTTQAPEIVDPQAKVVKAFSATESGLATLKETYGGKVYDCTTNAGDGEARHARIVLRDTRVNVEKFRQQLKAPLLEEGRIIDAEAKRITAEITALEDPIDAQIKAEEKRRADIKATEARAEAERLAKIDVVMRWLRERPGLYAAANLATLTSVIAEIEKRRTEGFESYGEGHERIEQQAVETLKQLEALREARQAADAEAARIAREREELAEQQRRMDEQRAEMQRQAAELEARQRAAEEQAARERAEQEARAAELERQQAALDEQARRQQGVADDALLDALEVKVDEVYENATETIPPIKVDPVVEAATDNGFPGLAASLTPKADAMAAKVEVVAKAVDQLMPTPKLGDGETLLQVAREAHLLLVGLLPGHTTTIKLGNALSNLEE